MRHVSFQFTFSYFFIFTSHRFSRLTLVCIWPFSASNNVVTSENPSTIPYIISNSNVRSRSVCELRNKPLFFSPFSNEFGNTLGYLFILRTNFVASYSHFCAFSLTYSLQCVDRYTFHDSQCFSERSRRSALSFSIVCRLERQSQFRKKVPISLCSEAIDSKDIGKE